jgi:signal peptidase I
MELDNDSLREKKIKNEILDWVKAILFAFILAWVIRAFVFEHSRVDGNSMNDTLQNSQHLIVYKLGYFLHKPQRGDIVTIEEEPGNYNRFLPIPDSAEVDYIKRIIGLPGETVDIHDNNNDNIFHVYINGKELNEPYAIGNTTLETLTFPIKIEPNEYLILGDNRSNSRDGRSIGPISASRIRGKAIFSVWPFKSIGGIYKNFSKDVYKNLK